MHAKIDLYNINLFLADCKQSSCDASQVAVQGVFFFLFKNVAKIQIVGTWPIAFRILCVEDNSAHVFARSSVQTLVK